MQKHIFLVDVLGSSSKITMKLNFEPLKSKMHYGFVQNQVNIFGLLKQFVKIQFCNAYIGIIKNTFLLVA
jgi:hypothetical protein